MPAHLDVHLVLDNASSYKTPKLRRWLARHPRFHLHFTPTSSSWINLVERWFGELTTKLLRRSAHRSIHAINRDIRQWIDTWNENPAYAWTKTTDQIPDSIRRHCQPINQTRHQQHIRSTYIAATTRGSRPKKPAKALLELVYTQSQRQAHAAIKNGRRIRILTAFRPSLCMRPLNQTPPRAGLTTLKHPCAPRHIQCLFDSALGVVQRLPPQR